MTSIDLDHPVYLLEVVAMHRWLDGDPDGFLEISADDVVYTDPFMSGWLIGKPELKANYDQIRGKVHADRFEFVQPHVTQIGEAAVLTYDFVSWGEEEVRWHCTETFRRDNDQWLIVVTHWSFQPAPQA